MNINRAQNLSVDLKTQCRGNTTCILNLMCYVFILRLSIFFENLKMLSYRMLKMHFISNMYSKEKRSWCILHKHTVDEWFRTTMSFIRTIYICSSFSPPTFWLRVMITLYSSYLYLKQYRIFLISFQLIPQCNSDILPNISSIFSIFIKLYFTTICVG